jgi:molybdopterin converting factor small subunit
MAKITIPTPLRKFTNNTSTIISNKETVIEALLDISTQFPQIKNHLFDEQNNIRNFIKIFIGEDDINSIDKEQSKIDDKSIVSIIPAIAGGV